MSAVKLATSGLKSCFRISSNNSSASVAKLRLVCSARVQIAAWRSPTSTTERNHPKSNAHKRIWLSGVIKDVMRPASVALCLCLIAECLLLAISLYPTFRCNSAKSTCRTSGQEHSDWPQVASQAPDRSRRVITNLCCQILPNTTANDVQAPWMESRK